MGQTAWQIFGREPSNDYFINISFLLSKWFQTRRFLWEFPIGSYVKLSSAVAAILGRRSEMPDIFLEGDHPRIISAKFGWDWLSNFRGEDFFLISSPLFSISSLVAILVGSRDHRTQFWKGAIQGLFHQSLVAVGPVVSEEKIFMWISHRVLC